MIEKTGNTMTELKLCKCCDKKTIPKYMGIHDHSGTRILYSYGCPICNKEMKTFHITKEAAIAAWNKWVKEG